MPEHVGKTVKLGGMYQSSRWDKFLNIFTGASTSSPQEAPEDIPLETQAVVLDESALDRKSWADRTLRGLKPGVAGYVAPSAFHIDSQRRCWIDVGAERYAESYYYGIGHLLGVIRQGEGFLVKQPEKQFMVIDWEFDPKQIGEKYMPVIKFIEYIMWERYASGFYRQNS